MGTALRSGSAAKNLFLSHAHADHIGSLPALLGMRGLTGLKQPLRMFMPIQLAEGIPVALNAFGGLHRWPLEVEPIPMSPGDEFQLGVISGCGRSRHCTPFHHLGTSFRRVHKLKPEFSSLPGPEIALRRKRGDDIFHEHLQYEFAYSTDTPMEVLDRNPNCLRSILSSWNGLLDEKTIADARVGATFIWMNSCP